MQAFVCQGSTRWHSILDWNELKLDGALLHAKVKPSIIEDIRLTLRDIEAQNVISKKVLESLAGKINHAAGLLITLRPFLQQLWAAIHVTDQSAPTNTVWRKQVEHSLTWFQAVFNHSMPGLDRTFNLYDYLGQGDIVEVGTDASPWGLGGWLARNGVIAHFFHCPVSIHDTKILGIEYGSHESQQVLEALAILVAVRAWIQKTDERMQLRVRSDNI